MNEFLYLLYFFYLFLSLYLFLYIHFFYFYLVFRPGPGGNEFFAYFSFINEFPSVIQPIISYFLMFFYFLKHIFISLCLVPYIYFFITFYIKQSLTYLFQSSDVYLVFRPGPGGAAAAGDGGGGGLQAALSLLLSSL